MKIAYVYGSLKEGFGNHGLLAKSQFLGTTAVRGKFLMIGLGGFPGVLESASYDEALVVVEAYRINENTLADLDMLESEGDFYHRRTYTAEDGSTGYMYILDDAYKQEDHGDRVDVFINENKETVFDWL